MNKATFNISEVATFLEDNNKPYAAKCLREFWGEKITNEDLQVWFQRHFGREQAYKLFRTMECVVCQNLDIYA